jgi:murein hydrolase activator
MNRLTHILSLIIALLCIQSLSYGQTTSEKLKKEQERLERKIANTKSLLNKTQSVAEASLNELKIIENQIRFREQLLRNYDNQIRSAELKVSKKDQQIIILQNKLKRLKEQYKKLLIYAYKHRNKYGKMMYIFSSENYYEAIKRGKYLRKISEIQKKQYLIIRQNQNLIKTEIQSIEKEKNVKLSILEEKKKEKENVLRDKNKQQRFYQKIKSEEASLMQQMLDDEKKKEIIKQRITAAIKKEIELAEQQARKKAEAEAKKLAEAKKAAEKAAKETNTPPLDEVETTKEILLVETKEAAALGKNFENNKGRLPWPVEKGTITEGFGKNAHPTLDNVFTNNNGIDISSPKNAQVRAVFEGEVTSVFSIPGAGKVVIIKHGNYRTVYSNLQDVYVSIGTKVNTKQVIGSLVVPPNSSVSVAHFEIHFVNGSNVQSMNPSLWVTH